MPILGNANVDFVKVKEDFARFNENSASSKDKIIKSGVIFQMFLLLSERGMRTGQKCSKFPILRFSIFRTLFSDFFVISEFLTLLTFWA